MERDKKDKTPRKGGEQAERKSSQQPRDLDEDNGQESQPNQGHAPDEPVHDERDLMEDEPSRSRPDQSEKQAGA